MAGFAAALLLLWLAVGPSHAQKTRPGAEKNAAELAARAQKHMDAREYQQAVELYRELSRILTSAEARAAVLFNAGVAYMKWGKKAEAIRHFRLSLDAKPTGPLADEARDFIAAMKRALVQERISTVEPKKLPVSEPEKPPALEPAKPPVKPAEESPSAAVVKPAPPRKGRGLRIAGITTAVAGLVAVGVGVYYGLDARSISNDLSRDTEDPWTDDELGQIQEGEDAERNMLIFTSAGAATIIAGGVLFLVGVKKGRESSRAPSGMALVPSATSSDITLSVVGRF